VALFALIVQSSVAADAFNQANNLPTNIYIVIATGVVTGILVPQITKAMKREDDGEDFINRLLTLSILVMAVVTLVCTIATPLLINLIVSQKANLAVPGYLHLGILLGYWCMPQIFFYGLYAVLGQVLNARGHFAAFGLAPALANVVQIAGLIGFWILWGYQPDPAQWSTAMIVLLGGSTTLGIAVQGLCLIWPLYRDGFRFHPRFGWRGYGFGEVTKMTGWTFAAVLISFLQGLVVGWAATAMRAGVDDYAGVSTQQYAYQLFTLPHSLVTVSIVTALFPAMAKAWTDRDNGQMKSLLRQGLTAPSLLIIPASAVMIGLGLPMIRLLIPSLTQVEANNVWWVLAAYNLGMWMFGVTTLKQRYYYAKQDGWTNFWLTIVPTVVQLLIALFALWFLPGRWGVFSIGIGNTVGCFVASFIFLWLVRQELGPFGMRHIAIVWAKATAASAIAAFLAWDFVQVMGRWSQSRLFAVAELAVGGLFFIVVFIMASAFMRITEVRDFLRQAIARIERLPAPPRRKQSRLPDAPFVYFPLDEPIASNTLLSSDLPPVDNDVPPQYWQLR